MNKCPFCEKTGKRSKLHVLNSGQTLLGTLPYYDEDGVFQENDQNQRWTNYECSMEHRFMVLKRPGQEDDVKLMA